MGLRRDLILLALFCGLLTVSCISAGAYGQQSGYDLIRFHVIANSDSTFDQSVKLSVRDAIIDEVNALLKEAESTKEADILLADHTEEIISKANDVLSQNGCNYQATASLGTSRFPTKTYGDITLPAGEYNAFRIILGEGKGKNWWCVLYPPLCFVDINDDTSIAITRTEKISDQETDTFAVDGNLFQVRLRSKLFEWLN